MVSISYRLFLLVIVAATTGCLSLLNINDSVAALSQTIDKTVTNKKSVYGPFRNTPAQGNQKSVNSPFEAKAKTEDECEGNRCKFIEGTVLVKLVPEEDFAGQAKSKLSLTREEVLQNITSRVKAKRNRPVFPHAQKPGKGKRLFTPSGTQIPEPDLTRWHLFDLDDKKADIKKIVEDLKQQPGVVWAEPVYERNLGDIPGPSTDPLYIDQWHLDATNVPAAWSWLEANGYSPGGSHDVVVAVIDSGVDYNHEDLAAGMWVNSGEIPGNGVDDDGNGFVDDVHGVNLTDTLMSGDPLDDNGHGTHVAGIIGAQADNGLGGVGIAYNSQIMAIKAAQYSGVLSSTDIAEAIYYAVEKGADVINMSFSGSGRSLVEEDALAVAYSQAVLVAAAGNSAKANLPCYLGVNMYPAAYPWVLGVMAEQEIADGEGDFMASFSNYDCVTLDNQEYELMAPGSSVWSTLPNNDYGAWSGTSMAAPVVSGIAALLRSKWHSVDGYSSRFIMGQIARTGPSVQAYTPIGGLSVYFRSADALSGLTDTPQPNLSYLEHWLFDTIAIDPGNDEDGIVDAGETVDLAITIQNKWGKADNVTVLLEPIAEGAVNPDPFVTMLVDAVDYGAVGSFNKDDNGLVYDQDGYVIGVEFPFRFQVAPLTPNNHVIPFRLTITARNGLDAGDITEYSYTSSFYLVVQRGTVVPHIISGNTTLTNDTLWIVEDQVYVESGASLTIEPGTQVQFYTSQSSSPFVEPTYARIEVAGALTINGSQESPVELSLDPFYGDRLVTIVKVGSPPGVVNISYAKIENPTISATNIDHAMFYGNSPIRNSFAYVPQEISLHYANFVCADFVWRSQYINMGYFSIPLSYIHDQDVYYGLFTFNCRGSLEPIGTSQLETNEIGESLIIDSYTNLTLQKGTAGVFKNNAYINNNTMTLPAGYSSPLSSKIWTDTQVSDVTCNSNQYSNNAFLQNYTDIQLDKSTRVVAGSGTPPFCLDQNDWGTNSASILDAIIIDKNDNYNLHEILVDPVLSTPSPLTYPYVTGIVLSNGTQPNIEQVGTETVTFTVHFNRDMDISVQPTVTFGPAEPFTDYSIHGDWLSPTTWAGSYNILPITGDGFQYMRVAGAVAADDAWLVTGNDGGRFRFEIITSGASALNLQATGSEGYIDLTWTQDDFELLQGFNMYRSTTSGGTYGRVNSVLIPGTQLTYHDTDVVPGQPYYYKFTVVSDSGESGFSNIATAIPTDTIPPVITHTPITTANPGQNLTITASASDNVGVQSATLYYRVSGSSTYASMMMIKTTGDNYFATVSGSNIVAPGIEYYIAVFDGISTVTEGRPDNPFTIIVDNKSVVTGITPTTGPSVGGTIVSISGSNFLNGAAVSLGGASCAPVIFVNSNLLTCTTPPHFPSNVDLKVTNPDAQSGLLVNAYTYVSTAAALGLPALTGGNNQIVQIPVNLANIDGLVAAELTVQFDASVLTPQTATTGTLTPGWSIVTNTGISGEVRLAMASSGGSVTGAGSLAIIEFLVVGAPGTSTVLHPTSVSLNDRAISVDVSDGTFNTNQVYTVSGGIHYWFDAAPLPATDLTLDGPRLYTGQSDASGTYAVSGVEAGDYTLIPTKNSDALGITAFDASKVLEHAAGITTLTGQAFTAGDVDGSGNVNSMDAFYILQKSVDLITLPFPGAGQVWVYEPLSRDLTGFSGNVANQDFTGVLLGDVSGNWPVAMAENILTSEETTVTVNIDGSPSEPDGSAVAQIIVAPNGDSYQSLDLTFEYNPAEMTLANVTAGAAASTWMLQYNMPVAGTVMVSMASGQPIDTSETMVELTFQLAEEGGPYPLNLTAGTVDEISIPTTMGLVGSPSIDGDVNQDGTVDLADAILALKLVAGIGPNDEIDIGADVGIDGKIGLEEVVYVFRKVAGIQ